MQNPPFYQVRQLTLIVMLSQQGFHSFLLGVICRTYYYPKVVLSKKQIHKTRGATLEGRTSGEGRTSVRPYGASMAKFLYRDFCRQFFNG
ncbi:hypothetical protein [Coleofasciculus sp. D1-CHI-01]|uniref:hypothetical protein n=1 Tax=Coleofasciculus sp. D1-CHI-01 TaxID=3068482 RepID=UPI0040631960